MRTVIVLGAIGNTPRQNRDNMRVIGGGGTLYALKAHIALDHPLVLRKWKNEEEKGEKTRKLL